MRPLSATPIAIGCAKMERQQGLGGDLHGLAASQDLRAGSRSRRGADRGVSSESSPKHGLLCPLLTSASAARPPFGNLSRQNRRGADLLE